MVEELELLLKKHFEQVGIICCEETCFCWDVQSFLTSLEEKANQQNAHADGAHICYKCGEPYPKHREDCALYVPAPQVA